MDAVAQPTRFFFIKKTKTCVCAARIIPTTSGTLGIFCFWRLGFLWVFFGGVEGEGRLSGLQTVASPKRIYFVVSPCPPPVSCVVQCFPLDTSVLPKKVIYEEASILSFEKQQKRKKKQKAFCKENNALQNLRILHSYL
uniref:Uncharacterized protein n=1 Tax=Micrurus lemniscatus lemniscatus TaxID=129467 RepID=A0A2D4JQN5_MICLE